LQKKYLEFQLLDQQLKQTQKQAQLLEEQLVEIVYTQQSLEELKDVKPGSEILVPVSNGMFAKATLTDSHELIVNVGSGAAVPKTIEAAQQMLAKQLDEVQKVRVQLAELMQQLEQGMLARSKEISAGA